MTSPRRVVLVEDDTTVRGVIEILLSTEPDLVLVGSAVTAEEGIELVRLPGTRPRAAGQPTRGRPHRPSGRADDQGRRAPVVVVLCTALDLASVAAMEPSIDGYLRKDDLVDLVDLVGVVRSLLDQFGSA